MFKKDAIFWWATAIFIMALVLAGIFKNQLFLFLMVGSYLLRPTLASLGLAKNLVDERQMSIQYRSGNIAFVIMIIACIILAVNLCLKDEMITVGNFLILLLSWALLVKPYQM